MPILKTQCLDLRKQKSNVWELIVETWELSWVEIWELMSWYVILIPPQKVSHLSASPDPRTPLVHHNHISPNTYIYKNHYHCFHHSWYLIISHLPQQEVESGDAKEEKEESKTCRKLPTRPKHILVGHQKGWSCYWIFCLCGRAYVPIGHCPIYFIRVGNPLSKVFKTFVLKWDPSPPNGRRFLIEGFWFLKSSVCISNTCSIFPTLTVKMIWEDCRGKQSDGSFTWFESTWLYCTCLNYYRGW